MSNLSLQQLSELEPWRLGIGLPRNALDPTWTPGPGDVYCDGGIEWEGGSSWWFCRKCGYVGSACVTKHKPVQHPLVYFLLSALAFMAKRRFVVPTLDTRVCQALFVAGASLRYAAVQPHLGAYVDQQVATR